MQPMNNQRSGQFSIPPGLQSLARLHPSYSLIELEESRAILYTYFDLAWEVFLQLEQEGKPGEALTDIEASATVKGSKVQSVN